MKNKLLLEMQQIREQEKRRQVTLPMPNYLFVKRYGREVKEEMNEITRMLGKKEWFFFRTAGQQREESMLARFQIELTRRAGVGKEYIGSVLIELSGEEVEKELEELLRYIDTRKHQLSCIYTMSVSGDVAEVKKQLGNYGFVRVVQGEVYDVSEQLEIFRNTLSEYRFFVDEEVEDCVAEFFSEKEWLESDAVKIRIQNIAREIVYSALVNGAEGSNTVTREETMQVLQSLQEEPERKRQIGFVVEGAYV